MMLELRYTVMPHGEGLPAPQYQTENAAGLDLLAAIAESEPLEILPGRRVLVPTGLSLEIPEGFEAQVRPRSGLALRHGITVLNAPGTIDADYRGELKVLLINLGDEPFVLMRGDRIAQLVVCAVKQAHFLRVETLSQTARGHGGFGSTG